MFNSPSKTQNTTNPDKKNEDKAGQDFVTHNMPAPHRFSGQTFSDAATTKNDKAISTAGPENHHKIGILIIIVGLILVGALFYFGYSYFIKPMLSKPGPVISPITNAEVSTTTTTPKTETIVPIEVIATSTPEISTSTTDLDSSSEPTFAEETPIILAPITVSTVDSDADGLTDAEEKIIGTDPNKADTDGDGYLDLAELKSDYDPLVPGQKNATTSKIITYKIDSKATLIYPASWDVTRSDINSTIIFADSDKAFIQLNYQDNPGKINPKIWFNEQFSGITPGEAITGDTWQGFYSQDGLAAYIFNKDLSKIYSFSCSPLTSDASSVTFFHLMVKTLLIK
jgi:Bacterial TSP3 repeat